MFKDIPRLGRRHSDVYGLNTGLNVDSTLIQQRLQTIDNNSTSFLSDSTRFNNLASRFGSSLLDIQEKLLESASESKENVGKDFDSRRNSLRRTGSNGNNKTINILVIGAKNVGKSAFTVRFITKRYIGDYLSGEDCYYDYSTDTDNQKKSPTSVSFLDTSLDEEEIFAECDEDSYYDSDESSRTSSTSSSIISQNNLEWSDGVIILYDIGDYASFEYATEKLYEIHHRISSKSSKNSKKRRGSESSLNYHPKLGRRRSSYDKASMKPVLLIGNKTDLMWRRTVSSTDVQQAIKDYPSLISCTELSVANGFDDVKRCVDELITVIKSSAKKSSAMAPARENLKKFLSEKFSLKQKHSHDELSSAVPRIARNTWRRGSVF